MYIYGINVESIYLRKKVCVCGGGGGCGGRGVSDVPISVYNQVPTFCLMCSLICLHYLFLYMTSCKEPYCLRYRQLEVGGITMYEKG